MLEKIIAYSEKLTWNHVGLAILAIAAYSYFGMDTSEYDMKTSSLASVQQQVSALERKMSEAEQFEKEYDVKKKNYANLVSLLQTSQGALPKQFFLPDLISDLLKEAKRLEVEIISIVPDKAEEQAELYNSLGFTIEIRGTFLQFFIFLDRLANMKRLVNVVGFDISKDAERPSVMLGGDDGAFASAHLAGGTVSYPGITGKLRVVTYRYRSGPPTIAQKSAEIKNESVKVEAPKAETPKVDASKKDTPKEQSPKGGP